MVVSLIKVLLSGLPPSGGDALPPKSDVMRRMNVRGGKNTLWEGGTRVLAVARGAGHGVDASGAGHGGPGDWGEGEGGKGWGRWLMVSLGSLRARSNFGETFCTTGIGIFLELSDQARVDR